MGSNSKLTLHRFSCWNLNGANLNGFEVFNLKSLGLSILRLNVFSLSVLSLSSLHLVFPELALSQVPKQMPPAKTSVPTQTSSVAKGSPRPVLNLGSQGAEVTELQAMLKLLAYYSDSVSGVYDQNTAISVAKFQKAAGLTADGIVGNDTWNRLLPPSPVVTSLPPSSSGNPTGASDSFPTPSGTVPNSTINPGPNSGSNPGPASTNPPKPTKSGADEPNKTASLGQGATPVGGSETVTLPILRLGMKGPAVSGLQERLKALGFLKGLADGIFGPETQSAVKAAQRNLKLEPDGVVGHSTWIGLLR